MHALRAVLIALLLPALLPSIALARAPQNAPRAQQNAPKPQGFKAEFLDNLDEVEEKLMELAEATPAERYGWRPASDVRSISEVYMHIVGANYFLTTFLGVEPPKTNGDLEKTITKKADVLAELRRSFTHLRNAVAATGDLEKPVRMLGKQTTHRGVLITAISHLHEHLGQSIAYARMQGVVPPWSR
jgi:uncharacterized damage-inducible protein DinB